MRSNNTGRGKLFTIRQKSCCGDGSVQKDNIPSLKGLLRVKITRRSDPVAQQFLIHSNAVVRYHRPTACKYSLSFYARHPEMLQNDKNVLGKRKIVCYNKMCFNIFCKGEYRLCPLLPRK